MSATPPPLPDPEYADFAPFWEGTARGELRVPACESCGRNVWPPRMACPRCGGIAFQWRSIGNDGVLFSWTTVGRAMLAGFEADVPYTVVVVEAAGDPAVRFVGRLAGSTVPVIGSRMTAVFDPRGAVMLVNWSPAD